LLGVLAPNTEDGTIVGANNTVPAAAAELLRNCRRFMTLVFLFLLLFSVVACLSLCKAKVLYLFGAVLS
jgi:hypothetical protein